MFSRLFTDHPHEMGETYWEHQRFAFRFAFSLFAAGAACAVHALVPALCKRTGSRAVEALHGRLTASRRLPAAQTQISPAAR
ncbi:MAG: DUF6356 family protein [Caulobacteraceae bacterium]